MDECVHIQEESFFLQGLCFVSESPKGSTQGSALHAFIYRTLARTLLANIHDYVPNTQAVSGDNCDGETLAVSQLLVF